MLSFSTPASERADRIRAAGIVNKRMRLGWFIRPRACMVCGVKPRKMEGHHTDYAQPHLIHWLCHSCHMKAHHNQNYLDGMEPFDTGGPIASKHSHRAGGRAA